MRIIKQSDHSKDDAKRLIEMEFECPICHIKFKRSGKLLHNIIVNRNRNKAGPFCSRHCAGIYGRSVQLTGKKLKIKKIIPKYTTNKELEGIV